MSKKENIMNVNGVKLYKDLHFYVPPILAKAIDGLVSAIERDDILLYMYMDDVTIVRVRQTVIGCFHSYFFLFVAVNSGDRLGLLFRRDSR